MKLKLIIIALVTLSTNPFVLVANAQVGTSTMPVSNLVASTTNEKIDYFLNNTSSKTTIDKDLLQVSADFVKFKKGMQSVTNDQAVVLKFIENIFVNKTNSKSAVNKLLSDATKYTKTVKNSYVQSDKLFNELVKAINKKVSNKELAAELLSKIDIEDKMGIDKLNDEQKQITIKRLENISKFLTVIKNDKELTTTTNGTVVTESGNVYLAYWDYLKVDRDLNKRSMEVSSLVSQKLNVKNTFTEFLYGPEIYSHLDLSITDFNRAKSVWTNQVSEDDIKTAVPNLISLVQDLTYDTLSNADNLDTFLKIKEIENETYLENLGFVTENFKSKSGLQIAKSKIQGYLNLKKKYRTGVYYLVLGVAGSKQNLDVANIMLSISDITFEAARKEVYAEYALESDALEKLSTVNLLIKHFGKFSILDASSEYYFKFNNSLVDSQYRSTVDKKHARFDWAFKSDTQEISSTTNTPSMTSSDVFVKKDLLQIGASLSMPGNWYYIYEQNSLGIHEFYISKEQVIRKSDMFKTGLTIMSIPQGSQQKNTAEETAKFSIAKSSATGKEVITSENQDGIFKIFTLSKLMLDPDYNYRTITKYYANTKTNTLTVITFEAPDNAWTTELEKNGNKILQSIILDPSK